MWQKRMGESNGVEDRGRVEMVLKTSAGWRDERRGGMLR